MFDNSDAEFMHNSFGKIPDGVINGKPYAEMFVRLTDHLRDIRPDDTLSHIVWSMSCINECFPETEHSVIPKKHEMSIDKCADAITTLSYHCMTMMNALTELGYRDHYFEHLDNNIIPDMLAQCETLPWFDFSDEIKGIVKMEQDLEEFLKSNEEYPES